MLIDRYVTREILKPFATGMGVLVTVFVAFSAAVKLTDAAAGEIVSSIVIQLIGFNTLIAMEILIPTTLYVAVLYAVGRLYRDSEMAALAAAGIGENRILVTIFKLALLISLLVGVLSFYARPWAYSRSYTLEQQATDSFDVADIKPGSFSKLESGGYVFFAKEIDVGQQLLHDVFVQVDRAGRSQVISAASARLFGADAEGSRSIEFENGQAYLLDRGGNRDVVMRFKEFRIRFAEEEQVLRSRRKAIPTSLLGQSIQAKDIAEYQWRISTPLATMLLALLAVPLSRTHPRQSRYGSSVIAIGTYVALFSLMGLVRNSMENEAIASFPGLLVAYVPAIFLLGLLLVWPRLTLPRLGR